MSFQLKCQVLARLLVQSFLMSLRPLNRDQWEFGYEKNLKYQFLLLFIIVFMNKVKSSKTLVWNICLLSKYLQDQWGISANVNNFLGFFITHSFPNSTTNWEKNAVDEGSLTLIFRLRLAPFQLSPLLFVSLCSAFSFWLFLSGWSP